MIKFRHGTVCLHYDTVDKVLTLEHSSWDEYIKTQDRVITLRHSRQGSLH